MRFTPAVVLYNLKHQLSLPDWLAGWLVQQMICQGCVRLSHVLGILGPYFVMWLSIG